MDVWGWLGIAPVGFVVLLALRAWRRHERMFPPDRDRVGKPRERRRGLRWIGIIYGGGKV